MNAAAAVEASDGIRLAPPLHRVGPLLRDVVLRESLQGADELAVHEPGRERIEVPGDRRHSHLVKQRQSFLDIAVQDAQPSSRHPSDGARRSVACGAHFDGALGPLRAAGRRRSASARTLGRRPATRAPASRRRPSSRRSARASQPRTGAISAVSSSRCIATRTAAPAAATTSPACTDNACAAPTPRWSRRDGLPRKRPHRATADRPDRGAPPRRPSSGAS